MDIGEDGLSDSAVFCDVDKRDWGYSMEVLVFWPCFMELSATA
jgi:hypothetical protein